MKYKVVPISLEITTSVRTKMASPQYGHPAFAEVATGYGPCRQCLKTFREGDEERILFTYNPFDTLSDLPLPGPVFIHKDKCESFGGDGFPPDLRKLPMLLEGYGKDGELVGKETFDKNQTEAQIAGIFDRPGVEFINIRNAEAGCFIARIERV